jgi:hypothetical protein
MCFKAIGLAALAMAAPLGLAGCANESASQTPFAQPAFLGSGLANMGGARSDALSGAPVQNNAPAIEPTSSSKVLSAIVFERVTGRTAYPDGALLSK